MVRSACLVLVALLLTVLCAPASAQLLDRSGSSERSHLSQDPQVKQARTLIGNEQHQAALEVLRPLLAAQSADKRADITDIRFLVGLSAIAVASQSDNPAKTELLGEAIAALRAILIDHPQLTRVRLELARAFFLKGDDDLSKTHFDRVIAGDPPAPMLANIRRFLHVIRARRRWSGYFSFNFEQNDNLNSGTETEVVYLFGLPFTLNEGSRPRSGNSIAFAAGREYQQPLGEHLRWRFGVDATHHKYRSNDADQTSLSLRTGPRWLTSRRSEYGLQATAGQQWVASKRNSTNYGLRFNARHQLSRQIGINGQVSWKRTVPIGGSDSIDVGYSLNATYLFSPLLQGSAGIGLSHSRPQPKRPNSGSRSRSFNLGLNRIFSRGWTVGSSLGWSQTRHGSNVQGTAQPQSQLQRQRDRKRVARLFLLNRGFTLFGFSPQFIVAQERQQSNSPRHIYQRTRFDLRFVRQF